MGLIGSLGLSKKKSTTKTNETQDLNSIESELQSSSKATTGTTTGSQSTTGTSGTTGTSTSSGTTSEATEAAKTSQQQGQSTLFSDQALAGLEAGLASLLGTVGSGGYTGAAMAEQGSFDPNEYVANALKSASATTQTQLDVTRGAVGDSIGAASGNNSMGDLLLARAENDRAATLAGVNNTASTAAQQILSQRAATAAGADQQDTGLLSTILTALKGGVSTTATTGNEATTGTSAATTSGTTGTTENKVESATTNTAQTVSELVDALLSGITTKDATQTTVGVTKSKGTDLSASLGFK